MRARTAPLALCVASSACAETLDAGSSRPHGLLPVDERNPLLIVNDGATDNWQGEYGMLLANGGGAPLVGIVVNANYPWPNLDTNVTEWSSLVAAARDSGLQGIPDPIASVSSPLTRPASDDIADTVPNRSDGALAIIAAAKKFSLPYRPLTVATGGRLTDVADAYLIDPTVADQIVVVSSLGALSATGATMSNPNGEMDPWADLIVSTRLRYVQVSAYYDQLADVPDSRVSELPSNPLGAWMAAKQPKIFDIEAASDQVSVLAASLPTFTLAVARTSANGLPTSSGGPELATVAGGRGWLVTETAGALASARLWELLLDARTFEH